MDMNCTLILCSITIAMTVTGSVALVSKITKAPSITYVEGDLTKTTSLTEEGLFVGGVCKYGTNDLTLYNKSLQQCVDECRSRPLCTAINVYLKVGVCRLNFETVLTASNCPNYIHWERATWTKQWKNGCESLSCSVTQKCVEINGSHSCVTSECRDITGLPNGEVFGNRVEVGMRKAFRCNRAYILDGSSSITCQSDGNWSPNKPVCTEEQVKHVYRGYNDDCEVTKDGVDICSETDHECRRNTCRCKIGLFFDPNTDKCVNKCTSYGMSTYQKFENAKLSQSYPVFRTYGVPDIETCISHCRDYRWCTSVRMSKYSLPRVLKFKCEVIASPVFNGNQVEYVEGYDSYFMDCTAFLRKNNDIIGGSCKRELARDTIMSWDKFSKIRFAQLSAADASKCVFKRKLP